MMRLLSFLFVMFLSLPVHALDVKKIALDDFGAWPVLHDGRIKTMESMARASFYRVSGTTATADITALQWLTEAMFDPSKSINRRVIHIERTPLLELPARADHFYTLGEVMEAFRPHEELVIALESRPPASLSAPQKSLLNAYQALVIYNQVIQSLSAVLPINETAQTYLDGAGSDSQRALITAGGLENNLIRFIPNDDPNRPLLSVWDSLIDGQADTPLIDDIAAMAQAWRTDDVTTWQNLTTKIKGELQAQSNKSAILNLEHLYVTINPIVVAMIFYSLGLFALAIPSRVSMLNGRLPTIGSALVFVGAISHGLAMVARSIILARPPTGTLYETFLFVSFIIVAVGLCVHYKNRSKLFLAGSVVTTLFILLISRFFVEGDSLNVLVAVLNTNFWLGTHVVCIIFGYAFCIIAAMIGHLYLLTDHRAIKNLMVPMTLVALLFTSVGTLLGGIWADQSWGRFWGWDPKENGALLITLWLIWVLHGRLSGHFTLRGFAASLALTNITVAVTWFGVNLLGVGLHSYGFITGIAFGLSAFCVFQGAVAIIVYLRHKKVFAP